jgi:hypothetical protein
VRERTKRPLMCLDVNFYEVPNFHCVMAVAGIGSRAVALLWATYQAQRMSEEELFHNHKSRCNGQAMRHTRIQQVQRFDRFLLFLALDYLLLVGMGLKSWLDFDPSAWCTYRRRRGCSVRRMGVSMQRRTNHLPEHLLRRVR